MNDYNYGLYVEIDSEEIEKALGNLKKKAPAAAKVAINATARETRKIMIARAKARYAVNAAGARHLNDLKVKDKATNTKLNASLFISSFRNDLGYYDARPKRTYVGNQVAHAPQFVRARVLKSENRKALTGTATLSKGFLVEFSNKHVGMVQRAIGEESDYDTTRKGYPRWRSKSGKIEKLRTMGSPSATAMHHTTWLKGASIDISQIYMDKLYAQIDKVIAREATKKK